VFEKIIIEAISEHEDLKKKIKLIAAGIIDSPEFAEDVKKQLLESIKDMDFSDLLMDAFGSEEVQTPIRQQLCARLRKVFSWDE